MPFAITVRVALLAASVSLLAPQPAARATDHARPKPDAHAAGRPAAAASQPPLRYDPPGAGPAPSDSAYEACIDHPSPDGLVMDCQSLQRPSMAKPRRKR